MARQFVCDDSTVVQTVAGKLQGFKLDSTYIFEGIKYADAKRFQSPVPVQPWDGVKTATSYGYVCPLLYQESPEGEVMVPHRYWPMDENCQYLNVWTQSIDPEAKKPVMVWLHGGGFTAGSSIEQVAYDGENMSKYGDIVFVSLNHRENILGYLDLSYYSDKYANSANVGTEDMVAALRWIRDNIRQFGGDPDNVTLMGQSGGGMKIWTLMQTPAADGLFHKGIIMSGVLDGIMIEDSTPEISQAIMAELGISENEVEKLETVPYNVLAATHCKLYMKFDKERKYAGINPSKSAFYCGEPRANGFTEHAKTIPIIIGTNFAELSFGAGVKNKASLSEEEITAMIVDKYGADYAEKMIPLFKEAYPRKNLADLLYLDPYFRTPTREFIDAKAQHQEAPTWAYLFAFELPLNGGTLSFHCSDIPFALHNTSLVPGSNVPGASDKMENEMFSAWVSFARYGNPNCPALPEWPACTPGDEPTMIFDRICEVRHNHDHELVPYVRRRPTKIPFLHLDFDPEAKEGDPHALFLH